MSAFNLRRLRDFIPNELPRIPSWGPHESMNPDDDENNDNESVSHDEHSHDVDPDALLLAEPAPIDAGPKSYLDLVNECDNFPYYHSDPQQFFAHIHTYYALYVRGHPDTELGYMLPSVVDILRGLADWAIDDADRSITLVRGDTEAERSAAVATTTRAMRAIGHFRVLDGWRDELYPVYGPGGGPTPLFSIERAASPLFGVVTYGCHMTAYTRRRRRRNSSGGDGGNSGVDTVDGSSGSDDNNTDSNDEYKIWVPRRVATKQTYGGMLDNSAAGGLATGEAPLECMVREAGEEAGLAEALVRRRLRPAGAVSYFHVRDRRAGGETRLLQPECQYVYDLELDDDTVLTPVDGEAEDFRLLPVADVKQALRDGEFKPNCALVLLDFFVRHGLITPESEADYVEIVARLHRRLDFPVP